MNLAADYLNAKENAESLTVPSVRDWAPVRSSEAPPSNTSRIPPRRWLLTTSLPTWIRYNEEGLA